MNTPKVAQAPLLSLDEKGQSMVEYALLIAMISVSAMALLIVLGIDLSNIYQYFMDNTPSQP